MQVYLLESEGSLFQVPVTYRDEPLSKTPESLIGTIEHSVLGLRYVHDGIYDDQFVTVLAGVASAGYGQSLGFAQQDGRWHAWPDQLRLEGTAELPGRPPVDRFAILNDNNDHVALQNDHIEMTIYRRLTQETQPNHGLLTTLPDRDAPTTLVEIRSLQPSE